MPAARPRNIPRYDTLTTLVRDEEGHGFSLGDFALNIRNHPGRLRLHRHEYPELFFFTEGDGTLTNDFEDYRVEAPALVFVDAGHVHAWPDAERLRGSMLSFDIGFALNRGGAEKAAALFLPPAPVVIPLSAAAAGRVEPCFGRMREEWETRAPGWLQVMRSCLSLVHVEAVRARPAAAAGPDKASDRLCREFLLLMEKHLHAETRPAKLAGLLGVSTDHLSATLRAVTAKTASQHLQERLLLEARRLLAHSHLDVSEIAWHLGFQDLSYFGRVFRRHHGMPPGQFRRRFMSSSPEEACGAKSDRRKKDSRD